MNLPRKRTLLAWHRWMGLFSALFLISLSITGLALNHTEFLKLDSIQIRSAFILSRYNMESGSSIESYRIHKSNTLSYLAGNLFYNDTSLLNTENPIGILEGDNITTVATTKALIYLTPSGELVETQKVDTLPFKAITAIGKSESGSPILATDEGNFATDSDWLDFSPYEGNYTVSTMTKVSLENDAQTRLLDAFQGSGVSLYRVILDLHSGRLFGTGGRAVMDLTAISIILLITSGVSGWLRKSRRAKTA